MKARVLIIGLTMATALLAQPPGGGFRRNASGTPPTPQQMIQNEVARLTRFLTLTTDQQTQITGILSADINNLVSLQGTLKTERAALVDAIKSNPNNVSSTNAAVSATQGQIAAYHASEASAIYAILSPDQKTKVGDAVAMLSGGGPGPGRGFGPRH